ncbi:MAG: carbohydrate-binding protein, partial [Flavisolibacter sp.]
STNIENNIVHPDVVDAMFRQVRENKTKPFKPHILKDRLIIYASDYDFGRSGMAYHDTDSGNYWVSTQKRTPWNRGNQYRNDGVDIGICNDTLTNGFSVGWTEPGEWLQYTVRLNTAGNYTVKFRTKSADTNTPGSIALYVDGKKAGNDLAFISNADNKSWNTTEIRNINLKAGENKLRIFIIKGGFEISYIDLVKQR